MIDIRCKVCEYCYELKKTGNTKSAFYCNHPNQRYIEDYFKKKRMVKAPGFFKLWKCWRNSAYKNIT